jgi:hypothetical protein
MPSIGLTWDKAKKLFSVPVHLQHRTTPSGEPPKYQGCQTIMYVDTGSSLTSITDREAAELLIDVPSLSKEDVAGIGGITKIPIAREIILYFLLADGNPYGLSLDKVAVQPEEISRVREKNRGIYKQTRSIGGKAVCLLGLDAIEKMNGVLSIDMRSKSGSVKF